MKTQQLKLSQRLGLAFLAMVLLTTAVGGFALKQLADVEEVSDELATKWLPSVKVLGELRYEVNLLRRSEADHMLTNDPAEMEQIEATIAEHRKVLDGKVKDYEALGLTEAEKKGLASTLKARDDYYKLGDELISYSRTGDKGDARMVFRGESRRTLNETVEGLQALVATNDKGSLASNAQAQAAFADALRWMGILVAAAVLAAIALGTWLVRSITRELGGEPADAAAVAQRVADGNLAVPIPVRPGDQASLMASLKRMQDSLGQIVSSVRGNAEGVASASGQISQGTTDLSSRTEEQASALEQTAASMKELATTVNANADSARDGQRLAQEASGVAARGGEVVSQVVDTMRGINESSRRIADIISVIDGIAFQTNILALNAAVEAARAGEQGRGFAVVAGEVRNLAQRSAEAAKEIKALITDSVERVGQGSQLVDQAGATMGEVVASIQRVSEIMTRISEASVAQSAGVAQIGEAVSQMDLTTQQNAALVEQSAAASDSLRQQAQQLVEAVALFKLSAGAGFQSAAAAAIRQAQSTSARAATPAPLRIEPAAAPAPTSPRKAAVVDEEWSSF